MGLIYLLIDFFKYPFDTKKDENKFHQLLTFLFKDYPAFLWEQPTLIRLVLFPLFLLYQLFKKK